MIHHSAKEQKNKGDEEYRKRKTQVVVEFITQPGAHTKGYQHLQTQTAVFQKRVSLILVVLHRKKEATMGYIVAHCNLYAS